MQVFKVNENLVQLNLPFRGQVGAGTVVPFNGGGQITLLLPVKYRSRAYSVYQACGDSFINDGIIDGTILVCREQFDVSEIFEGRSVIVRLPCGDLTLKKIYFPDDPFKVRLCSANRKYKPIECDLNLIQIIALLVVSYREHDVLVNRKEKNSFI